LKSIFIYLSWGRYSTEISLINPMIANPNAVSNEQMEDMGRKADEYERIGKILRENCRLCARLYEIIPSVKNTTILSIPDNKMLLNKFLLSGCKHFSSVKKQ
jgi:hypothetical protein